MFHACLAEPGLEAETMYFATVQTIRPSLVKPNQNENFLINFIESIRPGLATLSSCFFKYRYRIRTEMFGGPPVCRWLRQLGPDVNDGTPDGVGIINLDGHINIFLWW